VLLRAGYVTWADEETGAAPEMTQSGQEVALGGSRASASCSAFRPARSPPATSLRTSSRGTRCPSCCTVGRRAKMREQAWAIVKAWPQVAGAWSISCEAHLALGFSGDAPGRPARRAPCSSTPRWAGHTTCSQWSPRTSARRTVAVEHLEKAIAADDENEDAWRRLASQYAALHMDSARHCPWRRAYHARPSGRDLR